MGRVWRSLCLRVCIDLYVELALEAVPWDGPKTACGALDAKEGSTRCEYPSVCAWQTECSVDVEGEVANRQTQNEKNAQVNEEWNETNGENKIKKSETSISLARYCSCASSCSLRRSQSSCKGAILLSTSPCSVARVRV